MAQMSILKIVGRSLFSKPVTRRFPFVKRDAYPATRGHVAIEIGKCIFCSICAKKCPTDAIVVAKPDRNWSIDRLRCIACGACVDACPKKCLAMANSYAPAAIEKKSDLFHQETPAAPVETKPAG
jgi:ech hydrogenase subunit F